MNRRNVNEKRFSDFEYFNRGPLLFLQVDDFNKYQRQIDDSSTEQLFVKRQYETLYVSLENFPSESLRTRLLSALFPRDNTCLLHRSHRTLLAYY